MVCEGCPKKMVRGGGCAILKRDGQQHYQFTGYCPFRANIEDDQDGTGVRWWEQCRDS